MDAGDQFSATGKEFAKDLYGADVTVQDHQTAGEGVKFGYAR